MNDYTIEFNKLYNVCKSNNLTLPTGVLEIQYLESANLSEEHHRLALATCDKMLVRTHEIASVENKYGQSYTFHLKISTT